MKEGGRKKIARIAKRKTVALGRSFITGLRLSERPSSKTTPSCGGGTDV
jgi:hypothetical protein